MESKPDSLLSAALLWAEGGWKVLPVKVFWNDKQQKWIKQPLIKGGFRSASDERAQIVQWWARFPDAQIGGVPASAGYVVIDPDLGHDPHHLADLPLTRIHRTISGGTHWLYECDEEFGNEAWAPKIDVRSGAGFIVLPPSTGYGVLDNRAPVELPEECRCRLRRAQEIERQPATVENDIDEIRLRQVLIRIDPGRFPGYLEWATILAAIAACGGDGRLALEWSSGRLGGWPEPTEYCGDYIDMDEKLASFHRSEGKMAGYGTLWHFAFGGDDTPTTPVKDDTPDTAGWWAKLKIPPITQLIGPISTTSRVELIAPTGAGKTHVAMAISAALAAGVDWLHWHVPAPKVVLYVDGEMPKALMQERVIDGLRRLPADMQDGAHERWVLKSSSFYYIPPLNGQAGRDWVDERIAVIKPDLVIFDNIQSLTTGDMKETDSWRTVQPWTRSITDRGIAQIWVHHANKDGTGYGDKTREYQMDTVIRLMPCEDQQEGVSVDISFPKKREHHPGKNDAVYAPMRLTLADAGWQMTSSNQVRTDEIEIALGRDAAMQEVLTTTELVNRIYDQSAGARTKDAIKKDLNRHRNSRYGCYVQAGSNPVQWCLSQPA